MAGKKFDKEKLRLDLIPTEVFESLGAVLTFGAKKYGDNNWKQGIAYSRIYGALLRHLVAWAKKDIYDQESGLPHLWHAFCNLAFLVYYESHPRLYSKFDDRSVPSKRKVKAYLSHPIRGKNGDKATKGEMEANRQEAMAVAEELEKAIPYLDLYVPARHDEFPSILWELEKIDVNDILDVDCEILSRRDVMIIYCPDGKPSKGMMKEIEYAQSVAGIPTLIINDASPQSIQKVKRMLESYFPDKGERNELE